MPLHFLGISPYNRGRLGVSSFHVHEVRRPPSGNRKSRAQHTRSTNPFVPRIAIGSLSEKLMWACVLVCVLMGLAGHRCARRWFAAY